MRSTCGVEGENGIFILQIFTRPSTAFKEYDSKQKKEALCEFFNTIAHENEVIQTRFTITKKLSSLPKEELESIESITRKLLGGDTNTILNRSGDLSQLKSLEFILTNKDFFLKNKENITSNTNNTARTATVEALKHVYASEFQNLSDNEISSFIEKLNSSIPLAAALSDIRPLTNNNLSSDQFTTCIRGFSSNEDATSLTQYFNKHKKEIMSTPDQEQQQTLSVK